MDRYWQIHHYLTWILLEWHQAVWIPIFHISVLQINYLQQQHWTEELENQVLLLFQSNPKPVFDQCVFLWLLRTLHSLHWQYGCIFPRYWDGECTVQEFHRQMQLQHDFDCWKNPNLSLMSVLPLVEMHFPPRQFHSRLKSFQANHPWWIL